MREAGPVFWSVTERSQQNAAAASRGAGRAGEAQLLWHTPALGADRKSPCSGICCGSSRGSTLLFLPSHSSALLPPATTRYQALANTCSLIIARSKMREFDFICMPERSASFPAFALTRPWTTSFPLPYPDPFSIPPCPRRACHHPTRDSKVFPPPSALHTSGNQPQISTKIWDGCFPTGLFPRTELAEA